MERVRGRFAPTPSGRMHLGNLFAALLAWLDVRRAGGMMTLRIEDLDQNRCSLSNARLILDDLSWLGLDWDEGGLEDRWRQSKRSALYGAAFQKLEEQGLLYPCYCSRMERLAASAPHRGDGSVVYDGRCARMTDPERAVLGAEGRCPAWRVRVPDLNVVIHDGNYGNYEENFTLHCGDFIIRRSDGVFAYQLAVVVDDGEMGVTHVVRGRDLLPSAPRQAWLHNQLGYEPPKFFHTPLLLATDGRRLSKRDRDLDMSALRLRYTPEELTGILAWWAGLLKRPEPIAPSALVDGFSWRKVPRQDIVALLP